MDSIPRTIAAMNLAKIRKAKKIAQIQLAEMSGVTQPTISRAERSDDELLSAVDHAAGFCHYTATGPKNVVPSIVEYLNGDATNLGYNSSILVIRALRAKFPCK